MSVCVLDASFTFQWLFKERGSHEGYADGATVPALWHTEIANGLGMAERRGRLTRAGMLDALALLAALPLVVDAPASALNTVPVLDLMRTHRLTAYDATYLELAVRHDLPLATQDKELRAAASLAGVGLLQVMP